MRIQSAEVARILACSRRPRLFSLRATFDVPATLAAEIAREPAGALEQQRLLMKLLETSTSPAQRASAGSMLIDHRAELPSSLFVPFLDALVACGHGSTALQLYRRQSQSQRSSPEDRIKFERYGIKLMCRCFRMAEAERLFARTASSSSLSSLSSTDATNRTALLFLNAYAELRQPERVDRWLEQLDTRRLPVRSARGLAYKLVQCRLFKQLERLLALVPAAINAELVAQCAAAAAPGTIKNSVLAQLLSADGGLLNSTTFRRLLPPKELGETDIRRTVAEAPSAESAIALLRSHGECAHTFYLCYFILRNKQCTAAEAHELYEIAEAARRSSSSNSSTDSMYVQFMLRFLGHSGADAWPFILGYKLHTPQPAITGRLTVQNYCSLWSLIMKQRSCPIALHEFMLTTLNCAPLTPELLTAVSRTLLQTNDHCAVAVLYEYAADVCGMDVNWPQDAMQLMPDMDFGTVLAEAEPLRKKLM